MTEAWDDEREQLLRTGELALMTSKQLVERLVSDAVYVGRIAGAPPEASISYQAALLISAWEGVFQRIAAQETTHANATVRRMAAMASEAISDEPGD